ncbi:Sigma-70 region 2 [Rubritalea squalenifaciens DSM 18772]|uniref:Sigma-70 region 2 n=1 Tax=Rubritalea squalenifaciens DSM 18772 TaxID=1123071 RepID=A0A1M6LNX2_9BACT|nr:sigma-70 family RNA polymerase sigma factor [Rubritalea squalenifaciens]SHJ72888.1 Sigma-70 region 2 [Rubritalea squalenifaciens DSM 18772]
MTDATHHHHAWTTWIDEFGWRLLAHARQITRSDQDAEDLLQNVILELWKATPSATPDLPLAYRKISQRAIDLGRSSQSRSQREETWQQDPALQPEFTTPQLSQSEEHDLVNRAIAELDQPLREIISLKLWGELTFQHIAEILDIPKSTAAARYQLALLHLESALKPLTT